MGRPHAHAGVQAASFASRIPGCVLDKPGTASAPRRRSAASVHCCFDAAIHQVQAPRCNAACWRLLRNTLRLESSGFVGRVLTGCHVSTGADSPGDAPRHFLALLLRDTALQQRLARNARHLRAAAAAARVRFDARKRRHASGGTRRRAVGCARYQPARVEQLQRLGRRCERDRAAGRGRFHAGACHGENNRGFRKPPAELARRARAAAVWL